MKLWGLTQHTVRCPLDDGMASVTVRTDLDAAPSRRHRDVTACSLQPSTPVVLPARQAYFADVAPPMPFPYEIDGIPRHATGITCGKPCLAVLNAAESGPAEPVRPTSGVSDGLELVRRTRGPAMAQVVWYHNL
jgi:hypothetical protein